MAATLSPMAIRRTNANNMPHIAIAPLANPMGFLFCDFFWIGDGKIGSLFWFLGVDDRRDKEKSTGTPAL
jgi:hypothetical protein